jgi:DNA repair exonuclease SbcCD ATPase subunit
MAKTVEDILKDEGVIKPPPPDEGKEVKQEEEKPNLTKIIISIEKLQTEMNTLKDFKKQNDEITRELTEKIGEIRSMFFQRESLIKETETKVKTLDDIVSDISPTKYMRELEKINKELLETQAKSEKVEVVNRTLSDDLGSIKQTMQNIRSVENLEKILDEIHSNVSQDRKIKEDSERIAGKTERFYLEMENRMKEFVQIKETLSKLEDLTKELNRSMDVINIKLAGFVSKDELEEFRKKYNNENTSNKQYIENKLKDVENFLNLPSEETANDINQLKKRRDDVSSLLLNIEEQYKKALISEKVYNEIKQKNETILEQVGQELSQLQSGENISLKSLPTMIKDIDKRMNELEKTVEEEKGAVDASMKNILSGSKLSAIMEMLKTQNGMINDVVNKIKEMGSNLGYFDLRIRFFEVLDGLIRVDNYNEVKNYLVELETLVVNMKKSNLWNPRRQSLALNLLNDIAENWRKYGYEDVSKEFFLEIDRIKSQELNKRELK